ncbi:hypothetical protein QDW16_gp02 [Microbacterium phage Quenya]|uniref:hypothetical protein n=1 Tax=Microbacterium phage Quenya TaxID=2776868 RepID=UPI0018A44F1B|nr:hypothetical protein QDW16_gp02 [Microbacterium phage Quenya]QOP64302.1 hypothetical protein SEA_QUENYA_67 [Microbacterium phage Quenya]
MTQRIPIPKKAKRRSVVPWQYTVSREMNIDELQVVAHRFLSGTDYHKIISADVYPGVTIFTGVYWGTLGKDKDLSQVARRWDEVEADLGEELLPDTTTEYLVTAALQDDVVHDVIDLTQGPPPPVE